MTLLDDAAVPTEYPLPDAVEAPDTGPLRRENSSLRVRPCTDADVPFLWRLFSAEEISYRWIFRGRIPTPETVKANLHRPNILPQIVEETRTGTPFGYLVAYDISYGNGHAHFGTVIDAEHLGSGAGVTAALLFADYLFAVLPLRKLYLRSIAYSFAQYRSLVAHGYARIEGVLRDYEYFGGRYWDVYILAVDRDRFLDLRARTRLGDR